MKKSQLYSAPLLLYMLLTLSETNAFLAQIHKRNVILHAPERTSTSLAFFDDYDSYEHQPLSLSDSDLRRLSELQQRKVEMPILIVGAAILPGQTMEISSSDPKLRTLINHVLGDAEHNEIGIIGLNPHNNSPLNFGVSAKITPESIKTRNIFQTSLVVEGSRRFEIEDEPQLDDSGSFYKAIVDIVENREEIMSEEQEHETKKLSERVPELVSKWEQLVNDKGMKSELKKVMKSIGPMPKDDICRRALWVGSLVNPLPSLKLCFEIRPAMLACKNNYERIQLAVISLQSSIDFLSSSSRA